MLKKYLIVLSQLIFIVTFIFCQDSNKVLIIGKIDIIGLKNTQTRVLRELPIKEGDIWDTQSKNKLNDFIKKIQSENIFESGALDIKEILQDNNTVDLKITISEQLPWFMFALPAYSSSQLLKVKLKYWQFYADGYKLPIEASLDFLQKDSINFTIQSNDPVKLTDRLSLQFALIAYTSILNYMWTYYDFEKEENVSYNPNWQNGIENLYLSATYIIPNIEATITPSFGFGYGNVLTTYYPADPNIIDNQDHIILMNPKISFVYPIPQIGGSIGTNLGFGYKNEYIVNPELHNNVDIQEFSFSLIPNNPKNVKDPLDYPGNIFFNATIPYINATFTSTLGFAYKGTIQTSLKGSDLAGLPPSELSVDAFTNICKYLSPDEITTMETYYIKDSEANVYKIDPALSNSQKNEIWDILTSILYIYQNGLSVIPSFDFTFPIKNTGLSISPGLTFQYTDKWQPDSEGIIEINSNWIYITPRLSIIYNIPIIDAILTNNYELQFSKTWNSYLLDKNIDEIYTNKIAITKIFISLQKTIPFSNEFLNFLQAQESLVSKSGHYFKVQALLKCNPIFTNITSQSQDINENTYSIGNFNAVIEAQYSLYLPAYKYNKFKMRLLLFSSFNKLNSLVDDSTDIVVNWLRGKGLKYSGGWFGFVSNFEFWLNLFTFNTPTIGSFSLGKNMMWQMYWVFYIDLAFNLNSDPKIDTELFPDIIDYNLRFSNLSIFPTAVIGTAIKIYPKFVPLVANFEVNFNLWNYYKDKNLGANLGYEFSVSRSLDDTWFKK